MYYFPLRHIQPIKFQVKSRKKETTQCVMEISPGAFQDRRGICLTNFLSIPVPIPGLWATLVELLGQYCV